MNPCANNLLRKKICWENVGKPQTDFKLLNVGGLKFLKIRYIYYLMFKNHQGDLPEIYIRLYYRMNTFDYKLILFS